MINRENSKSSEKGWKLDGSESLAQRSDRRLCGPRTREGPTVGSPSLEEKKVHTTT